MGFQHRRFTGYIVKNTMQTMPAVRGIVAMESICVQSSRAMGGHRRRVERCLG